MASWVLGPHFGESSGSQDWGVDLIGGKGAALLRLPAAWVPPYGIVTTEAYGKWLGLRDRVGSLAAARNVLVDVPGADLRTLAGGASRLIVRSSATRESLDERGLYRSVETGSTKEDVAAACKSVWDGAIRIQGRMALLIQPCVTALASGHLSNERRLTPKKSDWVCQIDLDTAETKCHRVRAERSGVDLRAPLLCGDESKLTKVLARVAALGYEFEDRVHFEWVWDGEQIWIVQADVDSVPDDAVRPGEPWEQFESENGVDVQPESGEYKILLPWDRAASSWGKVACLQTFRECNLPVPRVYVLESAEVLRALCDGRIPSELESDLDDLLECPIVIRTDVRSEEGSEVMSPRTDVVLGIEEATAFMQATCQELRASGVADDGYCFLVHRYVPAKAAAIAYAGPESRSVLVDATYGSPDSLLYYAHDSFECGVRGGSREQLLRCKDEFIDIGPDGLWSRYWCEQPYDWRSSLSDDAIRDIALATAMVSAKAQTALTLMFFADVDPRSGYPAVLPWVYFPADFPLPTSDSGVPRLVGNVPLLRCVEDIRTLELRFAEAADRSALPRAVRVWPDVDLVRSDDFSRELVKLATEHDLAVELQGSILSHVFYVLRRGNVRVRCVDPFAPHAAEQVFDKLVRDRIPERIESGGESVATRAVGDTEYDLRLKMKVVEEALELAAAGDRQAVLEEAADVLEVIRSIVATRDATLDDVALVADRKRSERGGFDGRVVLVGTAEPSLSQDDASQLSLMNGAERTWPEALTLRHREGLGIRKGRSVELPLVPQLLGESEASFRIELGGHQHELRVRYAGTAVEVSLHEPPHGPNENQMTLDEMG